MIEREVKLLFPTPQAARQAVAGIAAPLAVRRLQDDALLDTRSRALRRRGCTLRLRREWSGDETGPPNATFVTFKGPVQSGTMKVREEHETRIDNADALLRAFEELGLRVWFRYQKYREEYTVGDVMIAVDETPVGTFVELEGSEEGILSITRTLGRSPAEFILDSYYRLFLGRRKQFGLAGAHMVFGTE